MTQPELLFNNHFRIQNEHTPCSNLYLEVYQHILNLSIIESITSQLVLHNDGMIFCVCRIPFSSWRLPCGALKEKCLATCVNTRTC